MHCVRPGDYHSLCLTHIKFYPTKVTPLTNLAEVALQGLCYCNSNARGWNNISQSGVFDKTDKLILQNGEQLRGVQEEQ